MGRETEGTQQHGNAFKVYSKYVPNLTRKNGSAFEKFLGGKLEEREKNKGREGGE
jgi:hypothetical protein